jgi:hypothetical protein
VVFFQRISSSHPSISRPNTTGRTLESTLIQLRTSLVGFLEAALPVIEIGRELRGFREDEIEGGGDGNVWSPFNIESFEMR